MIILHIFTLLFQTLMALIFGSVIILGKPNKYTYYGLICCIIFIVISIITLDHLSHTHA